MVEQQPITEEQVQNNSTEYVAKNDNENDTNEENPARNDRENNKDSTSEDDISIRQGDGPSRYNLRSGRNTQYSKHIGKVNEANDYQFINVKRKISKEDKRDTHWAEDIHKHTMRVILAQIKRKKPKHQDMFEKVINIVVTQATRSPQMSTKKGFEIFGERAIVAMIKEYQQLYNLNVFGRIPDGDLTEARKRAALKAINLIKEKRDGRVKGRTCADGPKQRAYIPKEEVSSPTISQEALKKSSGDF